MDQTASAAWKAAVQKSKEESDSDYEKDPMPSYEEHLKHMIPFWDAQCQAHIKVINSLTKEDLVPELFEPIKGDDDLYTMAEFREAIKHSCIATYDGCGVFTYQGRKMRYGSDFFVHPSEFLEITNTLFDGVVWYNK